MPDNYSITDAFHTIFSAYLLQNTVLLIVSRHPVISL